MQFIKTNGITEIAVKLSEFEMNLLEKLLYLNNKRIIIIYVS